MRCKLIGGFRDGEVLDMPEHVGPVIRIARAATLTLAMNDPLEVPDKPTFWENEYLFVEWCQETKTAYYKART